MVAEILAVELLVAGVFGGSETESGQGNVRGEDGVFALFFDSAFFPFPGEFIADGDGAHALLDPFVGITLGFVKGASAFGSQLGIFYFLDALVADFGQPAFEGFGFGTWDRLNEPKETFGVPALEALDAAGRFKRQGKGGDNLSPPLKASPRKGSRLRIFLR